MSEITRIDAIRIIENITDKDDPAWEWAVEDFYTRAEEDRTMIELELLREHWAVISLVLIGLAWLGEHYEEIE